jgi:hypothetical protein
MLKLNLLRGSFHFNPIKEILSRDEYFLWKAVGECLFVKLFHRSSNRIGICNCQFQGPFVSPILPDSSKPNVFLISIQKNVWMSLALHQTNFVCVDRIVSLCFDSLHTWVKDFT